MGRKHAKSFPVDLVAWARGEPPWDYETQLREACESSYKSGQERARREHEAFMRAFLGEPADHTANLQGGA